MSSPPPPAQPIRQAWFGLLGVITMASILQAVLLPRWPVADPLPQTRLQQALRAANLRPEALAPLAAHRDKNLATSAVLGWRLITGEELRLMHATVRHAASFQAAALVTHQPSLSLRQRRLEAPIPGSATGRLAHQGAIQSCLVPRLAGPEAFGVTAKQLQAAHVRSLHSPTLPMRKLIGLSPAKPISCVLITLRGHAGRAPSPSTWTTLLQALQPALQPLPRQL